MQKKKKKLNLKLIKMAANFQFSRNIGIVEHVKHHHSQQHLDCGKPDLSFFNTYNAKVGNKEMVL